MAQQSAAEKLAAAAEPEGGVVSVATARRLVLYLLGFWTAVWGLSLIFASGAGALGAGIDDTAAQRLLGVHVLILAPLYGLLAYNPTKYRVFFWVPYVSQAGITLVTLFDFLAGNRKSGEGVVPLVVAVIFLALMVFLWQAGRKSVAAMKAAAVEAEGGAPASTGAPAPRAPNSK